MTTHHRRIACHQHGTYQSVIPVHWKMRWTYLLAGDIAEYLALDGCVGTVSSNTVLMFVPKPYKA